MQGKVALITGANTGIGLVTARELAKAGAHVFIACRSAAKAEAALAEIRVLGLANASSQPSAQVEVLALDLSDLASVRGAAQTFLARGLPLHLLINNAGMAGTRGFTKSGFELAFGVNHIGHFLLTQLLLERVVSSGPARIVTVASKAHYDAKGLDWEAVRKPTKAITGLPEYAASKLANVLFSAELARQLTGTQVTTYSLHPGVIASDVWRAVPWPVRSLMKLGMLSTEEGAATTLHCALSEQAGTQSGLYYDKCAPREPSVLAQDKALAAELWKRSDAWVAAQ